MQFTRLFILDTLLIDTTGHNYEYAKSVSNAAQKQGLEVQIICNRKAIEFIKKEMNAFPLFRWSIFDNALKSNHFRIINKILNVLLFNFFFLYDLHVAKILRNIDSQTLIFLPNCIEMSVFSLILWVKTLSASSRPRIVCLFRRDPRILSGVIGRLMKPLVQKRNMVLATDSAVLAEDYKRRTNLDYTVLPIPHLPEFPEIHPRNRRERKAVRLVFLGDARIEKGVDTLVHSIALLDREIKEQKVEFVVQCHITSFQPDAVEPVRLLENLCSVYKQGLKLIKESVPTDEYYKLIIDADGVLLPYKQAHYYARTSGILAEAFAIGKPVVVTEGTWMSVQLKHYGAGVVFEDSNPKDLARAIRELVDKIDSFHTKAKGKSLAWKNYHNADRLLEIITSS